MKKKIQSALRSFALFAVTLTSGFALTLGSFNLFESLSRNQMRLLFVADIAIILSVGAAVHFFTESRRARVKKENELRNRHEARVRIHNSQYDEVNKIIGFYDNVA
jgi:hypothetical protein